MAELNLDDLTALWDAAHDGPEIERPWALAKFTRIVHEVFPALIEYCQAAEAVVAAVKGTDDISATETLRSWARQLGAEQWLVAAAWVHALADALAEYEKGREARHA